MKTIELIDQVKLKLNITSDLELAQALGTGKSRVAHWKKGRNRPDERICFQMAEILNVEPQAVIAAVRLEGSSTPEERGFWEGYARRYGMLPVCAKMPEMQTEEGINNTMYYAQFRRGRRTHAQQLSSIVLELAKWISAPFLPRGMVGAGMNSFT